jgi:hypothetical protein
MDSLCYNGSDLSLKFIALWKDFRVVIPSHHVVYTMFLLYHLVYYY